MSSKPPLILLFPDVYLHDRLPALADFIHKVEKKKTGRLPLTPMDNLHLENKRKSWNKSLEV